MGGDFCRPLWPKFELFNVRFYMPFSHRLDLQIADISLSSYTCTKPSPNENGQEILGAYKGLKGYMGFCVLGILCMKIIRIIKGKCWHSP